MTKPISKKEIEEQILRLAEHELCGSTTQNRNADEVAKALSSGNLGEALDSIQQLELVVAIEDRFEVTLDVDAEQQLESLSDLVDAVFRGIS